MQLLGRVAVITRYPVKSLAGEELDEADVAQGGIPGDRASAFFVTAGHARTGKTFRGKEHNRLHLTSDVRTAEILAREKHAAVDLRHGDHFFDAAPISVVFDRWVDEVSAGVGRELDFRRWRPNFFAKAAADFHFKEDDLPGCVIEAGSAVLNVLRPILRCAVIGYDVQTGEPDPEVVRYVAQERGNAFGIYCDVELAGVVRTGDPLRLRAR
jgi:uncharacterized protein YcbX